MGKKVNPIGIRLGSYIKSNSFWYPTGKDFPRLLKDDITIREKIFDILPKTSLTSKIYIERMGQNAKIILHTAKPGVVIGKKGKDIELLRSNISKIFNLNININVEEIKKPDLDAFLVAENVSNQIKKRVMFRKAMKRCVSNSMKQGAKGIKISLSGRLGGAEIARREWIKEGRIPLHTFRSNIDYAFTESKTPYGIIGVKVWIYKGDFK